MAFRVRAGSLQGVTPFSWVSPMNTGHLNDIKLWLVFLLLIYSAIKRNEPSPPYNDMDDLYMYLSKRIQSEKVTHWGTPFVGDSGKGKTRGDKMIRGWIPSHFNDLYLPLFICQNPNILGHLAGSGGGAYNYWSQGCEFDPMLGVEIT